MAVVDVLDTTGSKVSQVEINDALFDVSVNRDVLHQVVIAQLSKRRAGTVSVKGRSDVVGSGRKLYRQKGTGRARKGNAKSPLLRGGGVVFGPVSRSHNKKVMKKVRRTALKMALKVKFEGGDLVVLKEFGLRSYSTKIFVGIVKALKIPNSLVITADKDEFLDGSSRNVPGIKVLNFRGLNVLDILKFSKLVVLESSISRLEERLI